MKRSPARSAAAAVALVLPMLAGSVGCGGGAFGAPLEPSRLSALHRGESTTADLLLAFGEPNGRGAARFEPGAPRVELWLYDFSREQPGLGATHVELQVLLLFVREGRYDGHLWLPGTLATSTH